MSTKLFKALISTVLVGSVVVGGIALGLQSWKNREVEESTEIKSKRDIDLENVSNNDVSRNNENSNQFQKNNKENILEKVSVHKLSQNQDKENVKVENNDLNISIRAEDEQELKHRKEWDEQVKKYNIQLESVYRYGDGGQKADARSCILYRNGEVMREIADLAEGRDGVEGEYHPCSWYTSWSSDRFNEHEGVGLWIRGKKSEVQKLIKNNWNEYLKVDGFGKNEKQKDSNVFIEGAGWLTNLCKEEVKKDDWLEITCLGKLN